MSKPLVLITRPHEDAYETAQQVKAMGYDVIISPALTIEDTGTVLPDLAAADGLIVSSAHAVRALQRRHPAPVVFSRTVFAVGAHTAHIAREAGFHDVRSGPGTMSGLITLIRQTYAQPATLIHISGADIREDPSLALPQSQGWRIERVILYRAVPVDHLPEGIISALKTGQVSAILFYSARSAESFLGALVKDWPQVDCSATRALCLAPPVVDSLRKFNLSWSGISVSETTDQDGILALL